MAAGGTATFTVGAAGSPTLNYQWYEGANALSEGGPTVGGSGIVYRVHHRHPDASAVSPMATTAVIIARSPAAAAAKPPTAPAATLTVQDALTIVSPPMSLTERAGDHVAFAVGVAGGGPQFQWSFNGNPISGATSSALVLTNIQTGNNGTYSVTVQ